MNGKLFKAAFGTFLFAAALSAPAKAEIRLGSSKALNEASTITGDRFDGQVARPSLAGPGKLGASSSVSGENSGGLRRGGPPPTLDEPGNPIDQEPAPDKKDKEKEKSGFFSMKTLLWGGGGAVIGGLAGFLLLGGPFGALIGIGAGFLLGLMAPKLFGMFGKK